MLWLAGKLSASGATYQSLEFGGSGMEQLSIAERFTLSNMSIEMGGKAGLFEPDQVTLDWIDGRSEQDWLPVSSDPGASYSSQITVNLGQLSPLLACPHAVDQVNPVCEKAGTSLDQAVIGTCTNGRYEDLSRAAELASGCSIDDSLT